MSFKARLDRLRAVAHNGTRGVTPAHGIVDRADLLELLSDWERLDGEIRRAGVNLAYVTKDAWERTCRALHWRTAELKANGIEPMQLTDDLSQYPPDNFEFPRATRELSEHEIAALDQAITVAEIFQAGAYDELWNLRNRLKPFAPGDDHFDSELSWKGEISC